MLHEDLLTRHKLDNFIAIYNIFTRNTNCVNLSKPTKDQGYQKHQQTIVVLVLLQKRDLRNGNIYVYRYLSDLLFYLVFFGCLYEADIYSDTHVFRTEAEKDCAQIFRTDCYRLFCFFSKFQF